MKRPIRVLAVSTLLVSCGALALTGCSGSTDSSASATAHTTPADAKATGPVVIIDLRSADEYKQGHLEGAVNYDFSSGDFSSQISGLDRNSQYQIYGSDDQPKMASAVMRNAGFPSVTDLGTIDAAKNTTGAKIVTD
ncbi:rhodanese-like domain-containing protein [Actinomyces sp. ZJ308]|uniref:rhodanese-like domain-containing protein n=1 Tax=Actinomyces sp. ZJ308 TaxID=2708342 RepID=UPI00141F9807|nr:rhodanese-like domain-containing protein [Actinomyces sp. ZJ308]